MKSYTGDETNRSVRNAKHIYFTSHSIMEKDTVDGLKIPAYSFDLFSLHSLDAMKNDNRFLTGKYNLP